jgi:hypothetical protein
MSSISLATFTYKFRCFALHEVQNTKLNLAMFLTSYVYSSVTQPRKRKFQEKNDLTLNTTTHHTQFN